MLKVGLTGSIAVGKSYVCGVFEELGCFILDADKVARKVVEPNSEGLRLIVKNFGKGVLLQGGELDRKKLGGIVFSDESKRQLLNSIVHPLVQEEQGKWLRIKEKEAPNGIAIIDAALMIESGGHDRFEKIIVVWCDSDIQLHRLILRDKLNKKEAVRRIAAQMPQLEKKKFADFLIDTSGGFDSTKKQVNEVYLKLRNLLK